MNFQHWGPQSPFARFPRIRHAVRFLYASAMNAVAFFLLVAAACAAFRLVFQV
jgi:hypothetical protein